MRRILKKVAANDISNLGDTSTLPIRRSWTNREEQALE
jgi:hypothetical protein